MGIKDRLDAVYTGYSYVSYSNISGSIMGECLECGEKDLELNHKYYPDPDSWVECNSCGQRYDFHSETCMWIKKREEPNNG